MMKDKVVLITGPARGIGRELAVKLASKGAKLALIGLEPELLESLGKQLGPEHFWSVCDVTNQASLDAAVSKAVGKFGRLDVVVANAGIANYGTLAVTPIEVVMRTVDVNLNGVLRTLSTTLPHVKKSKGYFLLLSSASALVTTPGLSIYAATKAAVEHFGNCFRMEVATSGVDVGVAYPSWVDTDLVRDGHGDHPVFKEALGKLPGPVSRVTALEDCVDLLAKGIQARQRRIFVPRSLAGVYWTRHFFTGSVFDSLVGKTIRKLLPQMEKFVIEEKRYFGKSSAGMGKS